MPTDTATVFDIVNACARIERYVSEHTADSFRTDPTTIDAVLYRLTVIGEAVRRLCAEFRAKHADLPWRDIGSLRNRMVHEYDQIDLELIWAIVSREVPELKRHLVPLVPEGSE